MGVHHAGRGSAVSDQHGRPEPVHPRRPGLSGGPDHLQAGSPRAGGIAPLRQDPRSPCWRRWVPTGPSTPHRRACPNSAVQMSSIPESRHVIGTARMGDDPGTSVVDRWGRVHTVDNLVLADSSVFPTVERVRAHPDARRPGGPRRRTIWPGRHRAEPGKAASVARWLQSVPVVSPCQSWCDA